MSRQLPDRPNLEHLKKQAKVLLGELQARNPEAKLADALHAIAGDYGFTTWPKLRAYVDGLRVEPTPAAIQLSPFAGSWIANVPRSSRHPANPFRRAAVDFAVDQDTVTISHGFVDEAGLQEHYQNTICVDGKEHLMPNGYVLTASWLGLRVLETVATKDGVEVGRGTYEVSINGSTMTVTSLEQVIVLERQSS